VNPPAWTEGLALRICQTWRNGPPLAEWQDALADLDEVAAGVAYVKLRNERTAAPSIADLRATARAQAQDRRIETSTLPAPLDIDDETVQRLHRAVQAVTARFVAPDLSTKLHDRRLVGRAWRHDPNCARCEAHEAAMWTEVQR
jgi:hypothetical protein